MAENKKTAENKKEARLTSAKKRDKQNEKRRLQNRNFKASVKTAIRSYQEALEGSDVNIIKDRLNRVYSLVDKGVKTGRFKNNKAARTKSRLANRLKAS
jgi:small subunit ribosomal protein S20